MIWVGTWIGMMVRSPDAVMGVAFMIVFPLTFLSTAFVPIESLPDGAAVGGGLEPDQRAGGGDPRAVRQPGGPDHEARLAAGPPGRGPRSFGHGQSLAIAVCARCLRRYRHPAPTRLDRLSWLRCPA